MTSEPVTHPDPVYPRANWVMRWRRWLRPMLSKRGTPEAIATGAAVGLVVAFTPTIGLQLILAYGIATLLKANRPAAIIPVWITSPVTIAPIYAFTYTVGTFFVDGPSVNEVRHQLMDITRRLDRHNFFDFASHIEEFMRIGKDMFIPMWIGGLLVGGVCALVAYPLILGGVRRYRKHREHARQRRAERHLRRLIRKKTSAL